MLLATAASDHSGLNVDDSTASRWFDGPAQTDVRTPSQSTTTTTPTTPSAVEMTSDELDSDDSADPMTFQATLSSNPDRISTQFPDGSEVARVRSVEQPEIVPVDRSSFSPLNFQQLHFSVDDFTTQESVPDDGDMSAAAAIPPPAPPPQGLPPPPPPPPAPFGGSPHFQSASSSSGASLLSAPVVPRPRSQMKRLQWTKIPATRVGAAGTSNLWTVVARLAGAADGDARRQPDFDSLEELFCAQSTASGGGGLGGMNGTSGSSTGNLLCIDGNGAGQATIDRRRKLEEINILDAKRSMNVNIYLRQFAQSVSPGPGMSPGGGVGQGQAGGGGYGDVVQWLAEGHSERLGAEKLRGLLKILPEPDDVDRLTNYIDCDRSRLGVAERFYLELMTLPNYKLIVEALLIKEEFQTTIDSLKPAVDAIILSARDIKESKALQEIICTVLVAGNFLNSGGYAGEAAGFKLSSLLKLTEIRANKQRMNLMHFVAMETEKRNPRITDQLRQLKYLTEASQYTVESLLADINSLRDRVRAFNDTMSVVDEQFRLRMSSFVEAADTEMKSLELDKREMDELRLELATYFCEDEKTFKLDDCVTTFSVFCQRFIKASEENHERHLLNEQAEQRRRLRESQMTMKKSKSGLSRAFGSSDDLLSATYSEPEIAAVSTSTTFSALAGRRQSIPERSLYRGGGIAHHDSSPTLSADHRRPSRLFQRILSNSSTADAAGRRRSDEEDGDEAADELVQLLLQSGAEDSPTTCGSPLPRSRAGSLTPQQRQQPRRRASKPCLSADTMNVERERTPSPRQHLSIEDALRSAEVSGSGTSTAAEVAQGRRRESLRNSTATTQLLRNAASDGRLTTLADKDDGEMRVQRALSSEGVGTDVWIDTRVSFDGAADPKRAEHESRRLERRSRSRSKAGSACSSLNEEPSVNIPVVSGPVQSTLIRGSDAVDVSKSIQNFGVGSCDVSVVLSCDDEIGENPDYNYAAFNHISNPSTTESVESRMVTNHDDTSGIAGRTAENRTEVEVVADDLVDNDIIAVERLTDDDLRLWTSDRDLKTGYHVSPLKQQPRAMHGVSADAVIESSVNYAPPEVKTSTVVVCRQAIRPSTLPPAVPVDSASTGRPRGSFSSKLPSPTFSYRPIGSRSTASDCSSTLDNLGGSSSSQVCGKATLSSPTKARRISDGKIVLSRSAIDSASAASADERQGLRTVSSVLAALPPRARGRTASAEVESTLSSAQATSALVDGPTQADDTTSIKSSIRQHSTPTPKSESIQSIVLPTKSIVERGRKPKTVDQPSPTAGPAVTPVRRIASASSPPARSSFKFQIASKSPAASKISVCSAQSTMSSAARSATAQAAAVYSRPSTQKVSAAGVPGCSRSRPSTAAAVGLQATASSCTAHGAITSARVDGSTKRSEVATKKWNIDTDSRSEEIPAGKVNSRGDLERFEVVAAAGAAAAQRRGRASSACGAVAKPPLSKGRSLDAPTKRPPDAAAAVRRTSAGPVQRRASATSSATETGNRITRKPSIGRGSSGLSSASTGSIRRIAGRRE